MRAALSLAILAVVVFAFYLVNQTGKRSASRTVSAQKHTQQVTEESPERRIATNRVVESTGASQGTVEANGEDLPDAVVKKEEPKGPFDVSLGTHTLHFRADRGHAARMTVILTVPDMKTRKEVFNQRRRLRKMLYFLGSRRRVEGMRGSDGKDRFMRDLAERFGNVIRSGPIDRLQLNDYEVIEVDLPDLEKQGTE